MSTHQSVGSTAPSLSDQLATREPGNSALLNIANDIASGHSDRAANKLIRLWNWPNILANLVFSLQLPQGAHLDLQFSYVETGLTAPFFVILDDLIRSNNVGLSPHAKNKLIYQNLSETFFRVLNAACLSFPGVELNESQVAALEIDFLNALNHDESLLLNTLKSKLQERKPTLKP